MSLLGKLTSRLNIGARINGGFGVVLALLLAMATLLSTGPEAKI